MTLVIFLLSIAVLAGVGLGIFFWKQIQSDQKAGNACMYCSQQLTDSTTHHCHRCGFIVCARCWENSTTCPHCKIEWPRTPQPSASQTA
jgi:hypothetical protein